MIRAVDLHPEELIEREARGALDEADRARLDAHIAQCAACRFERQLRADFRGELESDVTPSSVERYSLAGALAAGDAPGAGSPPRPFVPPLISPPRFRRRTVSRAVWLLAAAALLAGGVAGANGAVRQAWSQIVGPSGVSEPPRAPSPRPAGRREKRAAGRDPLEGGERSASASAPARPKRETAGDDVLSPSAPQVTPRPVAPPPSADTAPSLFEASNLSRRRGDYARALQLQNQLESRFPQSREAHVARATTGRLLLDRGDPGGALARFDAYLVGGSGELGEETMVGRATALDQLGRAEEGARAWRALLAAYPDTPYAAYARTRLGGASSP